MTLCAASLPDRITAGLTFQATVVSREYPAPDWAMLAIIRGPQAINLNSTPNGADHVFSADAITTNSWAAGDYWYSLRAIQGTAVMEAGSGRITVLPNMADVTGVYDGRSQAEIALAAIDAVMAKRATLDQQRYTINNRELWRTPMADLLKLRAYYATQVARERAKAKGRSRFGRPIIVKFRQQ
jgi:hypothetical protein